MHAGSGLSFAKVCEEAGVAPNLFYRWQELLFVNGAAALESKRHAERSVEQTQIQKLEKKIQRKDEVLAELMAEHVALKKTHMGRWSNKTEVPIERLLAWLGVSVGKFYDWRKRYGEANHHNGRVPRDFWLRDWEKQRILDFQEQYPLEGYRRLTYMMLDAGIVAVSPASVWRVLHQAGRLARFPRKPSKKGTGFEQPLNAHEHWHVDIAHINVHGTFYYLCAVLDGASRYIVDWTLGEMMRETEVEILLQRAKETFPDAKPRVITDNGPQFIAKDFKEFIRISGMTPVRTSNKSIKSESIRPGVPLSLEDAPSR